MFLYFFRCEGCGDSESYLLRISFETKPALSPFLAFVLIKFGKKKKLEHQEDDGKLDEDDSPQRLAQGHRPETIVIEMENPGQQSLFHRFYIRFHQVFILFLLHKHSFLKKSAANLQ